MIQSLTIIEAIFASQIDLILLFFVWKIQIWTLGDVIATLK